VGIRGKCTYGELWRYQYSTPKRPSVAKYMYDWDMGIIETYSVWMRGIEARCNWEGKSSKGPTQKFKVPARTGYTCPPSISFVPRSLFPVV
jgi:hypothetical protein